jgi:hypothetical protein
MALHVGQKVVCVDGIPSWGLFGGSIYTVTDIGMFMGRRLHIDVAELRTSVPFAWNAARFRPLVETKTEILTNIPADPSSERWDNRRKVKVSQ